MKLSDIIKSVNALSVAGDADVEITGIACDSRLARPGFLFSALQGASLDGRAFVRDAAARGARAVMGEAGCKAPPGVTCVCVADARAAMAEAARAFHGDPASRLGVVGVTGTNGKTTVACMIRDALRAHRGDAGLIGTVTYEIGPRVIPSKRTTPESVDLQAMLAQMAAAGCRYAVMEVSSHALAQRRVWALDFDVAVFMNLSQDHLDYHGDMESYFAAKRLLFQWLGRGKKRAAAAINADDAHGRRLAATADINACVTTFGFAGDAAMRASDVRLSPEGSSFNVITAEGAFAARLSLPGRFNVSNALAAAAACAALGVPPRQTFDTLASICRVPGRMEEVPTQRGFRVFVDYAHTEDALGNALRALREVYPAARLILVFGCGGNRDTGKRPKMGKTAAALADFTIITSDNPRKERPEDIIAQVRAGFGPGANCREVVDRAEAIACAVGAARPGDVVLVAGKGHEAVQEFAALTIPFDDRDAVRKALGT